MLPVCRPWLRRSWSLSFAWGVTGAMDIPPDHIVPNLHAAERDAAIRELLRHLARAGAIPADAEASLFQAFRRREEVMTTGVGFGIAVPHIPSEVVTERVLALGRSSAGVDFSSVDGKPAKTIILMISPEHHVQG